LEGGKYPDDAGMSMMKKVRGAGALKIFARIPFCKQAYQELFERWMVRPAMQRFGAERPAAQDGGIDFLLDFALVKWGSLIGPMQVREEIQDFLSEMEKHRVSSFMEIGTAKGGTLFLFCSIFRDAKAGISLDLPNGKFGGGYPAYRAPFYRSFARPSQSLYLLREDSHSAATVEKVGAILRDSGLDFLFIDGDHSYEGAKRDFELYSPLVRKGGIIALHDIAVHPKELGCEVDRLWGEIKRKYKSREIIKDKAQGWGGIGIVYM
jgi:hypothetical protein